VSWTAVQPVLPPSSTSASILNQESRGAVVCGERGLVNGPEVGQPKTIASPSHLTIVLTDILSTVELSDLFTIVRHSAFNDVIYLKSSFEYSQFS
jgi:hypothetical protein